MLNDNFDTLSNVRFVQLNEPGDLPFRTCGLHLRIFFYLLVDLIEEAVRDHLRGFARTIPSFLMAYGDDETTLSTFDMIIPDEVFYEVTSITLDQFRFLRDGGSYTDAETGGEKRYPGKLFDPVVFDDSIKEFLAMRTRLGNYFDESHSY